jgi:uncharacterized protein (DUF1015 family)
MAEIRAFRAYRYNLARIGALSSVVAPPYDVIDPAMQVMLYELSPYNIVRLILNREESGDTQADNRYTRAAKALREWIREGILVQDSSRSLYVYHQQFEIEGSRYTRRGFFARTRLEQPGKGTIYPHEQTLAAPKADRLQLLQTTKTNLSPVFGLYPDDKCEIQSVLDEAIGQAPPLEAVDRAGVINRLWPVADQHAVSQVIGFMSGRPIFIADGHHRYETAYQYWESQRSSGAASADSPMQYVLMTLVSLQDPGLAILPTHRLVSGFGRLTARSVHDRLLNVFEARNIGTGPEGAGVAWKNLNLDEPWDLALGTVEDGVWQLIRFVGSAHLLNQEVPGHSQAWQRLPVSLLHSLVLPRLTNAGTAPQCSYVHLLDDVCKAIAVRACELAVLVPPVRMKQVAEIAQKRETLPPKSTYFYPKLLSGLVLNPLTNN